MSTTWAFSIDGHCAEVHDHFSGTTGLFDLTMNAIKYLHELEIKHWTTIIKDC